MWKILTAQFQQDIYCSLISCRLFPEEQNRYPNKTSGTGAQLLIDQHIFQGSKMSRKNLSMVWIDCRKAYDMIPHRQV